jgi:hypothetical protein
MENADNSAALAAAAIVVNQASRADAFGCKCDTANSPSTTGSGGAGGGRRARAHAVTFASAP